jgi:hypothetical protein
MNLYSTTWLKQQSAGRYVGHITLIPSQHVFSLTPSCYILNIEAANTKFIVLYLSRAALDPTIYHTRGEHANNYITDAV